VDKPTSKWESIRLKPEAIISLKELTLAVEEKFYSEAIVKAVKIIKAFKNE
jgi:hypothetical protein